MAAVVISSGAIICAKLQSNRHHQQTTTKLFYWRMPFLSPNQQCQNTEGTTFAPLCTKFTSNTVHSLDPGLGCAYQDKTITGAK